MIVRKSLLTAGAITAIGLATVGYGVSVSADTNDSNSLPSKIAQKFNLNQDEVQKVFDEHKEEIHQEHQQELNTKLDEYVSSGKITAEQKTLIQNKLEELHTQRESNKDEFENLSKDERKSKMEEKKSELETWAEQNGLDKELLEEIMHSGRHGKGHGHGPEIRQ